LLRPVSSQVQIGTDVLPESAAAVAVLAGSPLSDQMVCGPVYGVDIVAPTCCDVVVVVDFGQIEKRDVRVSCNGVA
jgi:hypothetical protein